MAAEIGRSNQRLRARIQAEESARLEAEARAQGEETNGLAAEEKEQADEANRLVTERIKERQEIQRRNQELQDRVAAVGEGEEEIREFMEFVREWFGPLSCLWQW